MCSSRHTPLGLTDLSVLDSSFKMVRWLPQVAEVGVWVVVKLPGKVKNLHCVKIGHLYLPVKKKKNHNLVSRQHGSASILGLNLSIGRFQWKWIAKGGVSCFFLCCTTLHIQYIKGERQRDGDILKAQWRRLWSCSGSAGVFVKRKMMKRSIRARDCSAAVALSIRFKTHKQSGRNSLAWQKK